ncbi:VOC family protein [Ferruginibacter sp.]
MILKTIPVLPALNIQDTIMFYESKLGFKAFDQGGYVVMKKDHTELHFFQSSNKQLCENSCCFIKVSDIECFYTELSALEIIHLKGKLEDKPRGIKEFSIRDNNGNLLRFIQEPGF